jgi:hypothetical protein
MSQSNTALINRFREEFAEAAKSGLEEYLATVENEARRLAPIRKVFAQQGGRRKTAWRNVFETRAVSKAGAILAYDQATTLNLNGKQVRFTRAEHMQRFRARQTGRGKYMVQVRSFKNVEPYSSPARRSWTESNLSDRRSDPSGRLEPFIHVGGSQDFVFSDYDKLNYEGRRALTKAAQRFRPGGYNDFYSGEEGVLAVHAGKDLTSHVEGAEVPPHARFGKQVTLQLGGGLRKSIEAQPVEEIGSRLHGSVVAGAPYALYVEFGTAKHGKAQPYLRPALMRYRYLLAKSVGSNIRNR